MYTYIEWQKTVVPYLPHLTVTGNDVKGKRRIERVENDDILQNTYICR